MESDILLTEQQHYMTQKCLTDNINHENLDWQKTMEMDDDGGPLKRYKRNRSHDALEIKTRTRLMQNQETYALSPITELSKNLLISKLGTPTYSSKVANGKRPRQFRALQCEFNGGSAGDGAEFNSSDAALFLEYENKQEHPIDCCKEASKQELLSFNSMSSTYSSDSNSLDDDFIALYEMETAAIAGDKELGLMRLPSDLDALISGTMKTEDSVIRDTEQTPEMRRRVVRRCLSMIEPDCEHTHVLDIKCTAPAALDIIGESETTPMRQSKLIPTADDNALKSVLFPAKNVTKYLRKSVSMNDADIMSALSRADDKEEPELIGDLSKPHALPLLFSGIRHRDLKTITCDTLAQLINGSYENVVASFSIIDCRYPYEYDGGHICGAKNFYTHQQILDNFPLKHHEQLQQQQQQQKTEAVKAATTKQQRQILIFHCEFSSERGPKLMRFLRNNDRASNTYWYPTLDYPEIYLLHNGYKEFYETHSELCTPCAYVPMLMPVFNKEYRHFRAKTKSWNGDTGLGGSTIRPKKSRSRLSLNCAN